MAAPYVIKNVEALWPKLDRTYAFDQKANQSMPCDPMAPNAEYSIELKMDSETAKHLYIAMVKSYQANKKPDWPDKPANPMTKHDDGTRTVKCILKGQYNGEKTRKPLQFDSKNNPMDDDFQLTTGSKINIQKGWKMFHQQINHNFTNFTWMECILSSFNIPTRNNRLYRRRIRTRSPNTKFFKCFH